MEVRAGYKQTETGAIPEEWDSTPLKGKVGIAHGFAFSSEHFANHGPYRLTTPGHFYETGGFREIGEKQKYYIGPVSSDYLLQPGDVIVAMTEQADGLLGSAAVIPEEHSYLHNQRLGRVKTLSPDVELDYLVYVLNSSNYRAKVRETAAGTKVKHTSPEKLLEIAVRLPPLPEQRAIAEALSDMDALLGVLNRLIAKKRDLKQAAVQQLISGKMRLPGFQGEWLETTLGQIGECVIGLTYKPENVVKHGLLVLRSSNVQNGRLAYDDNVYVNLNVAEHLYTHPGDLLICVRNGSRALIGKCALIDKAAQGFTFGAFMSVYRTKYWHFIFHAFQSESIQQQIRDNIGATINQITNKDMKAFRVKLPPEDEQAAVAEVLSDMDAELTALEQRRDKTRALKQGMMQELLTGRIRLV